MCKKGLFAAAALSLLFSLPTHAQLLDDGGFELATDDTQTSNSAWVMTVNFPDSVSPAAQFEASAFASDPPGTGVWFRSFEGQQAGGDPPADADVTQVVSNVDGGDYTLTFRAKREANFTATEWSVVLSSSGTGGTVVMDLLAGAPNDASWYQYQLDLTGVSPGDDLTVTAQMIDGVDAQANPQSAFVDTFELVRTAGPGPGATSQPVSVNAPAWLTLMAGVLLLIGWRAMVHRH